MANITPIQSTQVQATSPQEEFAMPEEKTLKKTILIALSTLFALGMLFSYVFGAPWLLTLTFFALALAPLFPLGKFKEDHSGRISEK